MNTKWEHKCEIAVAAALVVLVWGCGAMESDSPSPSESEVVDVDVVQDDASAAANKEGDNEEDSDTDNESAASEATHRFGEEEQGEDDDEPTVQSANMEHSCAVNCLSALWCGGDEAQGLSRCIERCEDGALEEAGGRAALECVDRAQGCEEVLRCDEKLRMCESICEVYDQCGKSDDTGQCRTWCAEQFWNGRLVEQSRQCVSDVGVSLSCENLAICGLSGTPQDVDNAGD